MGRLLKLNDLIKPFKDMVDRGALYTKVALQLAFLPENEQMMVYEIMKEKGLTDITRVGLYGLTYKENVDDMRESPTLQLLEVILVL